MEDERTKSFQQACEALGVEVRISPGLDPDAETLRASGDARYGLAQELGRGGQGRVLHAVDQNLKRSVALKVMSRTRKGAKKVQAFLEEAIITAGLEHPNIVPAYDVGYTDSIGFYYTMKRLSGQPLSTILEHVRTGSGAALKQFSQFRLLVAFVEICRAMAYAHSRGVVHADLKPANVLIGTFGEVVVVDWGLAQILGPEGRSQARAGARAGTPQYMAPEQFAREPTLDAQSDVWALGIILYSILTQSVPFDGTTPVQVAFKVLQAPLIRPSVAAPDARISPELDAICARALQKNPADRYASVSGLMADVDNYLEGTRVHMRRIERAVQAVEESNDILEALLPMENALDELLDGADPEARATQAMLVFSGYANAASALLEGHDSDLKHRPLEESVGDLYWRIFGRIYPSRFEAPKSLQREASALLTELSRTCLTAIVRTGEKFIEHDEDGPVAAEGDPWLTAVLGFCRSQSAEEPTEDSAMTVLARRIDALRRVSLFANMSSFDLLPIAEACTEERRAAGEVYFEFGDKGDALYIVLEGAVNVVRDDTILETFRPVEVFGEVGVIGLERTAGVVAAEDTLCLVLPGEEFREIVAADGRIGWAVLEVLGHRLTRATQRESRLRTGRIPDDVKSS